jgi:hypothetical protein
MPPVGFKPTIPASARSQTYALDRGATGTGDKRHRKVGNTKGVRNKEIKKKDTRNSKAKKKKGRKKK